MIYTTITRKKKYELLKTKPFFQPETLKLHFQGNTTKFNSKQTNDNPRSNFKDTWINSYFFLIANNTLITNAINMSIDQII